MQVVDHTQFQGEIAARVRLIDIADGRAAARTSLLRTLRAEVINASQEFQRVTARRHAVQQAPCAYVANAAMKVSSNSAPALIHAAKSQPSNRYSPTCPRVCRYARHSQGIKLAAAVMRLANEAKPPLRFIGDGVALDVMDNKLASVRAEVDSWRAVSAATDYTG